MLNNRERVRDTATLKALGMSPRQVMAMVAASTGVPTPAAAYGAVALWELIAIPLAGIVVAVIAAMIPGRWAARTKAVEVLYAE